MLFSFHLFKLEGGGRNLNRQMDLGCIERRVEERRLHQSVDIALHLAGSASLQVFLDRISGQQIRRSDIAVATSSADRGASTIYFDFQSVTTAFIGNGRLVAQKVILVLIFCDPIQSAQQVIGVDDDKSASAIGELVENLLVVAGAWRELRNDCAGLRVGIVQIRVGSVSSGPAPASR